jgi:HEAT repeat protein
MTLKRLAILLAILIFLAGVGIAWLWQYAYTPEGRARVIIAQLKNDTTSLRGWLLQHHLVRPVFVVPPIDHPPSYVPGMANAAILYMARTSGEPAFRQTHVAMARQSAAANELVRLGHELLPLAIEALRDENYDVELMAILACGKFHDPAAIQPLVQRLRDAARKPSTTIGSGVQSDYFIQWRCIDSLAKIGPKGFDPILDFTKDCDPFVGIDIPEILADSAGAAVVPALIVMLDNTQARIRAQAAYNLARFPDKRATDALIRHLGDESVFVRQWAVYGLGLIGDPKAVPPLKKLLKDTDPNVRDYAYQSLLNLLGRTTAVANALAKERPAPASQPGNP